MAITHCLLLLLSIITVKGISGQYYSQLNPNSRYYSGNYNGNYHGNYNGNLNPNLLRYPEVAVRPGELTVEVNGPPGQTPCRNKEANKEHKESLWWTLPIPPMELDGTPEKPQQQVKQPEPVQQVEQAKPQMNSGGETGAIQQKHGQIAPTSTAKAQVAPAAPTPQAVVQVVTTAKHESSSSAPSKQDRNKVAQMQKQQQVAAAPAQQTQPQNTAPVPSQLVVSNKDNSNQQQMITNKSVATMRAPGRAMAPIPPHGANKQKMMLNMNMIDPAGYQYSQEAMPLPQGGYRNPYFNSPYFHEPQFAANRGYRGDNNMINSMAELADNMYKNFDANDAEIGGGGVVGDNNPYGANQAHPNMVQYETNFAPLEQQDADQWPLSEDERNKRNPLDDPNRQKVAIS